MKSNKFTDALYQKGWRVYDCSLSIKFQELISRAITTLHVSKAVQHDSKAVLILHARAYTLLVLLQDANCMAFESERLIVVVCPIGSFHHVLEPTGASLVVSVQTL